MAYWYADETPFPVEANFLETIARITRACVELLQADGTVTPGETFELPASVNENLLLHELPETATTLRWRCRGRRQALLEVTDESYFRLRAVRHVYLSRRAPFAGPVRLGELLDDHPLPVPQTQGLLHRRVVVRESSLRRYYLVHAALCPDSAELGLSPSRFDTRARLRLRIANRRRSEPVLELAHEGRVNFVTARGGDAEYLARVCHSVEQWLSAVARHRTGELIRVELDGEALEWPSCAVVVQRLIDAIAPLVAEIQYRCGRKDALVLTHQEGGRPHQLVLEARELAEAIFTLPPEKRGFFEPLGLVHDRAHNTFRAVTVALHH
jgi:hypothetical protein